ncbi:MAG: hypothetical protein ACI4VM_07595, partial [Anaerovoracaceae bacterium]
LFLAIAVTLLLMPEKLVRGKLAGKKRYVTGAASLAVAVVVMGIVYVSNGGFPALNLIFV